ncbi:MAG: peptide ABC transporter substrate-binding protein [Chakrabartia sp.]
MVLARSLILSLPFMLLACGSEFEAQKQKGADVLVRIAEDEVKSLDPQTISDLASLRIAADQFEGLTRLDASGNAEAGLADTPDISADGLVWYYPIRKNVRFSDGKAIDAPLFVRVFDRLHDPKTSAPTLSLFDAIKSVEAVNAGLVRITLRYPFPALPELLAHPAMAALPLHRRNWTTDRPMVTSGAYRLTAWALNDHIRLEANVGHAAPIIKRIEWRPVSDGLTALRLFQAGGADVAGDFPSARLSALRTEMPKAVKVAPYRGVYYFAFNTRRPPFDDVRVRRALNLAIERRWIAGPLLGIGTKPAWGVVPRGIDSTKAYLPAWAKLDRATRLKMARILMQQAGYGPEHPLSFDIRFNSDTDHRRVSVALAAMWKPLGVEAHLLNSESSLHFASLRRGDFALARSGWIADFSAPENFLSVHHSAGGAINYSGYANPIYDRALESALRIADPESRALAMRHAEAIMMHDVPVLPLYFYVSKSLVSPRVEGWVDNVANVHPSRTLRIEKK